MSASLKDRKALIIGGGPVGLSAAYVLKKQCGLNIEVYEGASELVKVSDPQQQVMSRTRLRSCSRPALVFTLATTELAFSLKLV